MYDKQQYKDWYEKNKEKQKLWSRNYYQKHKDHIAQVHKTWAQKNMDQGGSIWRKYNRWKRIRNPNLDKEYYEKYRERILAQKKVYYRKKTGVMYRPLPSYLTIKESRIHELGLFALENITIGTNMGMSHVKFGEKIIRTPLGGFINHSNTPNCVKAKLLMTNHDDPEQKIDYIKWNLVATEDIREGEELTVRYTFYNI